MAFLQSMIDIVCMLKRWEKDGWEVHPINLKEFQGWI